MPKLKLYDDVWNLNLYVGGQYGELIVPDWGAQEGSQYESLWAIWSLVEGDYHNLYLFIDDLVTDERNIVSGSIKYIGVTENDGPQDDADDDERTLFTADELSINLADVFQSFDLDDSNVNFDNFVASLYGSALQVEGSYQSDTLYGSPENDTMDAGGGDDVLYGDDGDDVLHGGDGNDVLYDGFGSDEVYGDAGDDTIYNIGGSDLFDGGDGNDTLSVDISSGFDERSFEVGFDTVAGTHGRLNSTIGQDTISGIENFTLIGNFNAVVTGGDEDNIFITDAGDDVILGGDGNDRISSAGGDDTIYGGLGDDTLDGGSGDDKLYGGAGNDTLIHSGSGAQLFDGGDGIDTYKKAAVEAGSTLSVEVNLTTGYVGSPTNRDHPAQDTVVNIENIDFSLVDWELSLIGDDADNVLIAGGGNDTLNGGAGNDDLDGGDGDDILTAGDGDDILYGGGGDDQIYGGEGDDQIWLSTGLDYYVGGDGNDTIMVEGGVSDLFPGDISISLNFAEGTGSQTGGPTVLTFSQIENLKAGYDPDDGSYINSTWSYIITGSDDSNIFETVEGDDTIVGGVGDDVIIANGGDDSLDGGSGDDEIYGGSGDDTLNGGSGSDKFIFEAGFGNDIITDFTHGVDELKFYDANGNLLTSTDILETQNEDGDAVLTVSDGSSVTLSGVSVYTLPFSVVSQKSGDTVTFSFFLDPNQDPGNTGVGSFNATLGFEPNNLTYVSSSFADVLTGVPNATAVDSGTLGLGGFALTPVTDLDIALFSVTFEANAVTEPVQITLSEVEVDATSLSGGSYTIDLTGATLSGSVVTRSGAALSDVLLETDTGLNTQTSSVGAYELDLSGSEQLLSGSLSFSNTGSTKAISAADALDALKLSVGLPTDAGVSDAFSLISADFDQNGKVTASDALEILKYSVGLPTEQNAQWVFLDTNADYSNVGRSTTNYTEGVSLSDITSDATIGLTGILIGDVNDSYSGLIA